MHRSVSYIVWSFHFNRLILLRAMQENKSGCFFTEHSVVDTQLSWVYIFIGHDVHTSCLFAISLPQSAVCSCLNIINIIITVKHSLRRLYRDFQLIPIIVTVSQQYKVFVNHSCVVLYNTSLSNALLLRRTTRLLISTLCLQVHYSIAWLQQMFLIV